MTSDEGDVSVPPAHPASLSMKLGETLYDWLADSGVEPKLQKVLKAMFDACKEIGYKVRTASCDSTSCFNNFGDEQLAVDILANNLIFFNLDQSGVVSTASSEEEPVEKPLIAEGDDLDGTYSVAFDPLDGSSIVDTNFAVGTLFGVWPGSRLTGITGRELSAAGLAMYGPRVSMTIAVEGVEGAHEFTLVDDMGQRHGDWVHTNRFTEIGEGKLFAPGNLRATQDNKGYNELVDFWVKNKYQLRYTGGMVPDVFQLLVKGKGVFVNPSSDAAPAKLRLLYEVAPLAYIVEKAGGKSSNGLASILDVKISSTDDRSPVAYGSADEVERYNQLVGSAKSEMTSKANTMMTDTQPAAAQEQQQGEGIKLVLTNPRGFCEGVVRAIDTVEEALKLWGPPIYVKHEIVHNRIVCDRLKNKGVIFIEDLNEVPEGEKIIYSAHGIPPEVRDVAKQRNLMEVDATCPLVTKVHVYAKRKAKEGYHIILIGHADHVETIGTKGEAPDQTTIVESVQDVMNLPFTENDKLFYATQTTLSMDDCKDIVAALKLRYPHVESIPSGSICFATTNRQGAMREVVEQSDLALVVGDQMSSNSKRLRETAELRNVKGKLIQGPDDIREEWLDGVKTITLTAGASTPEDVVQRVVDRLKELGVTQTEEFVFAEENVNWKLPRALTEAIKESEPTPA
ncbi:unnamed protein product [Vitrella brassicaformis CCMP3155]|uniref:Uncharacterized protein n=2 Tax=Vitrella brassicaformis TaxID=1169539 RepID=A0A0G4FC54_VITBC|nr:unnamed protein product [Vitrella brassicaformis CCMP3155]|eukprot:CEM10222.1 unnamed protein product [Vitrella brassicaformis CCMP3155]